MQIRLQHIFFVALLVSLVSLAYGLNYMYCSHIELTSVGDRIKFWHGDSIFGPLRVDGEISIMQDPQFFDYVITSAPDFWQGSAYNPGFHGPRPIFNAPALPFPQTVPSIRAQALAQGHYFNQGDTMMARVHIEGDSLKIWWTRRGLPFDTSSFSFHALPDSAVVFFDCSIVHLWGTVTTTLICGVAGRAGLEDNVLYASSNQNTGQLAPNHPEKFALVAEGEIKVLNTWANGREDSHGRGLSQPNPDSTSIALNGLYVALGESFTFDQQNDVDSGYVHQNPPGTPHSDDRGTIYLWGGLTQYRRGYVHRATPFGAATSSTGYNKWYHWDDQLRFWNVGVFNVRENVVTPSLVDFGSVPFEAVRYDTVTLANDFVPIELDSLRITAPFSAVLPDSYRWEQQIVLAFSPNAPGVFSDTLRFYLPYYQRWVSVALQGVATPLSTDPKNLFPSEFSLSASPNPFNSSTRIYFSLRSAGEMRLTVFDILGREIAVLRVGHMSGGAHELVWDASGQSAGVYFVRLESSAGVRTTKLLLLK